MDSERVEQLLLIHGSKLPPGSFDIVREKLYRCNDATRASIVMSQLKDPTISLILSILLGYFGVDRFYIGSIGIGVGKLLNCGGAYIWWIVDIFLIMDATRDKNLETILTLL